MATEIGGTADWQRQWFIVGRWQEFEGEWRANLLRILAVGAFYAVQLTHFHFFATDVTAERPFHRAATALAVVWTAVALAVIVGLRRGFLPASLKYVTTGVDILLLTVLAAVGSGPTSPVVLGYFLILALAALRFSLPLVRCATLSAMLGYLATVGAKDASWFDSQHATPPAQQLIMLVSLGLTGVMLGQVVRRAGQLAAEFARRILVVSRGDQ